MATVKDIARLSGVSPSTVSRVLSGDASFSVLEETRNAILAAAKELNYRTSPRKADSRTRQMKDYKIGLVADTPEQAGLQDPYYGIIRMAVERELHRLGLQITAVIRSVGRESYETLLGLDGIIVIGKYRIERQDLLYSHLRNVVFVDYAPDESRYDSVIVDFNRVTEMAVDHLLALGYRRIGFIGARDSITAFGQDGGGADQQDQRHSRFESYMREQGLYDPRHVHIGGNYALQTGYQLMQQALTASDRPEAYVVASDPLALAGLRAIEEAGLKVPADIAIVGIDDIEMAAYSNPPLTTVKVFTEQMGQSAVNLLMDRMTGREIPLTVVVPSRLIVRGSCGGTAPV